jgi:hypothetical protein
MVEGGCIFIPLRWLIMKRISKTVFWEKNRSHRDGFFVEDVNDMLGKLMATGQ